MSREIKFRVHCEGTGEVLAYEKFNTCLNWGYYWYDANIPKDDQICETMGYFKHPHPLGRLIRVEFTGITDKNGVEIYEGDIASDGIGRIAKVEFHDSLGSCGCCYDAFDGSGFAAFDFHRKSADLNDCRVIGNIYQNPELLK